MLLSGAALAWAAPASALVPHFSPGVHDYVERCGPGTGPRGGQGWTFVRARAEYHVRCLPAGFPRWTVTRHGRPRAEWYLVTPKGRWVVLFDRRGTPVWWRSVAEGREPVSPTLLRDGNLAWYPSPGSHFGVLPQTGFEEHRLDGALVRRIRTVGVPTDVHELVELPSGHFLLEAYRPRRGADMRPFGGPANALVYDAEVQELTRAGRVVWRWSSRGHIALAETRRWWPDAVRIQRRLPVSTRTWDPIHINSLAADGNGLLISARHTDAIYRIDRRSGRVDWKLGGTPTARSLRIVGDPHYGLRDFGGQHDVRVLPDRTVTLYDNGSGRERPPRVLRFRIDAPHRTATLLEQLTYPPARRSSSQGSARRMAGGNWLVSWASEPYVTEMTPAGDVVRRLTFPDGAAYRAVPVPFGRLSAQRLRAAMDRMHPRGPAGAVYSR
ncbi:MAG: hypothetical protein QOJ14_1969 [Thermoleophilaceae bacterium]|nr:hypothetical protein [Thermoleophilaceae bacterium]